MATQQATLTDTDEEPWKDDGILHDLYHDEGLNQSEIADRLGTTASTISYWMGKLEVETSHTKHSDGQEETLTSKCVYHDVCGNETPGPRSGLCIDCLDLARRNSRAVRCIEQDDYDEMNEYVRELYDTYGN